MPRKILVVDDEAKIRELVEQYLARASFTVVTARDGREAMEVFRREQPDLVILDQMLPEAHGMDVIRVIRQEGDTPVIMLTAMVEDVDKVSALEAGADDYITKPFNPRELLARVRAVLRRVPAGGAETTVFISSVMREYETRRAAVREAVDELTAAGFRVKTVAAEDLPATTDSPRRALLRQVADSDVCVAILGGRYGYVNPETGLSATHEEYRRAREFGKSILIFVEQLPGDAAPEEAQAAFLREVQDYAGGHYLRWFANDDQLKHEVYRALERLVRSRRWSP